VVLVPTVWANAPKILTAWVGQPALLELRLNQSQAAMALVNMA
jgi:hypothetical protein